MSYRPPREGYQPPSLGLPAKPPPPVDNHLSKSPARRRDVPPAVPSPPSHSTRTSPPRPLSIKSVASPSTARPPSSPQKLPVARPDQWYFTPDEVASTPSIIDGLSVSEERLRRAKGVNFIFQAGIMLDLPQITLWVAGVFFHRFYMRRSMVEEKGGIHHYNIAATALFLANKTEENCRKTKDLIIAVAKVAQKNAKLIIDEQSKEYWRWRDSILNYEEVMLEQLTFDLMVGIPYHPLYEFINTLEQDIPLQQQESSQQSQDASKQKQHLVRNKAFRNAAWTYCNDLCLTVLPLLLNARDVAISAIFFSASILKEKVDDVDGEAWWKYLKGDEGKICMAMEVITEFYKENPLRKQDNRMSPSPTFNLEGTRRRLGTASSQQEGDGTPMGTDRGTQSPRSSSDRGRANGNTNGTLEDEEQSSQRQHIKQEDGRTASEAQNGSTIKYSSEAKASSLIKSEPDSATSGLDARTEQAPEASFQSERGDSDASLKEAANNLAIHNGRPGDSGLRSPSGAKRKNSVSEPAAEGEPERKRTRTVASDEDEGEISGN
ncbi:hypothetical protein SMACR_02916 [Sordaria macrospora]|uniref:RNA polymerase II holoenzyme cyclin-like subunit n=2 Tax=Sordaria macrospora TaxID=5147 RepID=F7VXU8_SORMK|nr:uncharacterized protein SMAC_02916 [Sordaria macrospora k-hell]KAA8634668.1 hypothetical protein SMACR_02916 [Sordaria macrospora]KAH7634957.1 cyclin-like protein [Sordaria sp. MPI-SDFR-AT-0083]WPJ58274.1 hypothetical protein SMAC4_02916 [Sordaria macrospora]CCC10342.1 unnamed protein product [Sordaria macrospora k-hell]